MLFRSLVLPFVVVITLLSSVSRADEYPKSTGFSADITGLWYTPGESGWGVNFIQQSQTIFATMFVHGPDNRPTWYSASDLTYVGTDAGGAYTFSGGLYQTSASWFGTFFNSATVSTVQVGFITVRFSSYGDAQLTYSVNGVNVIKNIVPFTWRYNNITGRYIGAVSGQGATCNLPLPRATGAIVGFDITQVSSAVTLVVTDGTGAFCNFSGTVTPVGKLSNIDGTYICTGGGAGSFAMRRVEGGIDGLSGAFVSLSISGCSATVLTVGAARVN